MTREVQDDEGVRWSCAQPYAGLETGTSRVAEEAARTAAGVRVVCTPSGGSRSVELELPESWADALSDEDLLARIGEVRG